MAHKPKYINQQIGHIHSSLETHLFVKTFLLLIERINPLSFLFLHLVQLFQPRMGQLDLVLDDLQLRLLFRLRLAGRIIAVLSLAQGLHPVTPGRQRG